MWGERNSRYNCGCINYDSVKYEIMSRPRKKLINLIQLDNKLCQELFLEQRGRVISNAGPRA